MSFLQKFCELWLLIGRGDRTHPYISPHPTSSHNSQYFRRTVLAKICGAMVSRNYRETIAKLSSAARTSKSFASCGCRFGVVIELIHIYHRTQPVATTRNTFGETTISVFLWNPVLLVNIPTRRVVQCTRHIKNKQN